MKLHAIEIHNYKSLRNVSIAPSPLSVIVGANAAGKSNFCDALDFLAEAYRLGLEIAVSRKGGYENICYRRLRRSKASIRFHIEFELAPREWRWPPILATREIFENSASLFTHTFEIRAESENIRAPFHVTYENLQLRLKPVEGLQLRLPLISDTQDQSLIFSITRKGDTVTDVDYKGLDQLSAIADRGGSVARSLFAGFSSQEPREQLPKTDLLVSFVDRAFLGNSPFRRTLGSLRVFQLNPRSCRESGVPTPNPELDRFGANLPAVVEFLKGATPDRYSALLKTVRAVMPTLQDLSTQYTHTKTLALFITEEGVARPWAAEDVSDGTIQTVALLAAVFDPRTSIVVIEEPENSVHPWAIRKFIEAARSASRTKQVVLTTHSPVLVNQLVPQELWIARRVNAETKLEPALALDPSLAESWGEGQFTLSDYLDSGAIPEAVPTE